MITDRWFGRWSGAISLWLAIMIGGGIAGLAWFGYRAADEWQRSSALLVDRRATEVANTLTTALTRDMRSVQTILDGRDWAPSLFTSPYEVVDLVAVAFARYPYPEVFFGWQSDADNSVFFARSERLPSWLASAVKRGQYPVAVLRNRAVARRLLDRIGVDVKALRTHSIFEVDLDGSTYQVIARPTTGASSRSEEAGGFAVLVNIDWAHQYYFAEITGQVARIAGAGPGTGLVTSILDEHGEALPGLPAVVDDSLVKRRRFPVMFFDPTLIAFNPPGDLPQREWTVHVGAGADPTLTLAAQGARRTLVVIAAGAVALVLGLLVTTRAARAMATVSEMRSDFVSTVTHELKTPVQVIRSVGETLSRGRVSGAEKLQEYAQLLVQESHRLSRLIDNLLAYSRVTDVAEVYFFEPLLPHAIVADALRGFHRLLADREFEVRVDVPDTLPQVRADRTSIVLALDNLVDNAMRYSGSSRQLVIGARERDKVVEISVRDEGEGIAPEELDRVKGRFARGRSVQAPGSGLGLAIVNRIVTDHAGTLTIESTQSVGTVVTIALPRTEAPELHGHPITHRRG